MVNLSCCMPDQMLLCGYISQHRSAGILFCEMLFQIVGISIFIILRCRSERKHSFQDELPWVHFWWIFMFSDAMLGLCHASLLQLVSLVSDVMCSFFCQF